MRGAAAWHGGALGLVMQGLEPAKGFEAKPRKKELFLVLVLEADLASFLFCFPSDAHPVSAVGPHPHPRPHALPQPLLSMTECTVLRPHLPLPGSCLHFNSPLFHPAFQEGASPSGLRCKLMRA